MSVCMSAVSAGISEVLIKYAGKYVNIYFIMKITFLLLSRTSAWNTYTCVLIQGKCKLGLGSGVKMVSGFSVG